MGSLGDAYRDLGQVAQAEQYLEQSLTIFEAIKSLEAEQARKWLSDSAAKHPQALALTQEGAAKKGSLA